MPALVSMLSPVLVASSPAENATIAEGIGSPASRAARQVMMARPPLAESQTNAVADGSTPSSRSARCALSASSIPAGNGASHLTDAAEATFAERTTDLIAGALASH